MHDELAAEPAKTVDAYQERFAAGPVGTWTSSWGSSPGPTTQWEFSSDGTGSYTDCAGQGDRVCWFVWTSAGDRMINLCETRSADRDAAGQFTNVEDEESVDWSTIAYDFKLVDYYGPTIAMFAVPEHETFKFWWTLDYLRRVTNRS